jgi:hypothetical protein
VLLKTKTSATLHVGECGCARWVIARLPEGSRNAVKLNVARDRCFELEVPRGGVEGAKDVLFSDDRTGVMCGAVRS